MVTALGCALAGNGSVYGLPYGLNTCVHGSISRPAVHRIRILRKATIARLIAVTESDNAFHARLQRDSADTLGQ